MAHALNKWTHVTRNVRALVHIMNSEPAVVGVAMQAHRRQVSRLPMRINRAAAATASGGPAAAEPYWLHDVGSAALSQLIATALLCSPTKQKFPP